VCVGRHRATSFRFEYHSSKRWISQGRLLWQKIGSFLSLSCVSRCNCNNRFEVYGHL